MSYITHKGMLVLEWMAFTVATLLLPVLPQTRALQLLFPQTGGAYVDQTDWISLLQLLRSGCLTCNGYDVHPVYTWGAFILLLTSYFLISWLLYRKYRRIHGPLA